MAEGNSGSSNFHSGDPSGNGTRIFAAVDEMSWGMYTEVCDLMYNLQTHCTAFGFRFTYPIEDGGTWVLQTLNAAGDVIFFISFSVKIIIFSLLILPFCPFLFLVNILIFSRYIADCSATIQRDCQISVGMFSSSHARGSLPHSFQRVD